MLRGAGPRSEPPARSLNAAIGFGNPFLGLVRSTNVASTQHQHRARVLKKPTTGLPGFITRSFMDCKLPDDMLKTYHVMYVDPEAVRRAPDEIWAARGWRPRGRFSSRKTFFVWVLHEKNNETNMVAIAVVDHRLRFLDARSTIGHDVSFPGAVAASAGRHAGHRAARRKGARGRCENSGSVASLLLLAGWHYWF